MGGSSVYLKEVLDAKPGNLIVSHLTNSQLDKRLKRQIREKQIRSEQWFREPANWYEISSYINPYRAITDEIGILFRHERELSERLNKTLKIFWGIGIGDSEIFPVIWDLKSNDYVEINAIDVIKYFLEGFILCLKNLERRDYNKGRIMLVASNALFEEIGKERIRPVNSVYRTATHICFGNTVGNFDQEEVFDIFRKNSEKGDYLLLGYHLLGDVQSMLDLHERNARVERFITEPLNRTGRFSEFSDLRRQLRGREIEWRFNPKVSSIEAWLGDILLFRSRKYQPEQLQEFAQQFGFAHITTYTQGDSAVGLFELVEP